MASQETTTSTLLREWEIDPTNGEKAINALLSLRRNQGDIGTVQKVDLFIHRAMSRNYSYADRIIAIELFIYAIEIGEIAFPKLWEDRPADNKLNIDISRMDRLAGTVLYRHSRTEERINDFYYIDSYIKEGAPFPSLWADKLNRAWNRFKTGHDNLVCPKISYH